MRQHKSLQNLNFGQEIAKREKEEKITFNSFDSISFDIHANFQFPLLSPVFVPEPYEVVKKVPYTVEVSCLRLCNHS